uniref:DDE Tnp4 domain-containing protein n=1 Tax=Magallana gigas TaxID=29159 RepID=A0A8W8MT86_MAGGI
MEEVIKAQLNEDLFIEDETDIFIFIAMEQTWIMQIILNLERRRYNPRLEGFSENIVPQFDSKQFLRHFRETLREVSNTFAIGTTTVHEIIMAVSETVNENLVNVINWPDANTQQAISRQFQLQSGLPGIIGCLDGTHIRLSSAPGGDKDYFNRKNFPSIQLQVVADCDMLIRDAYTGWPGCTHDARVLRNSSLFDIAENGQCVMHGKFIIADSAYPLRNWLMTPFRDNGRLNAQQRRFNQRLSVARQIVERVYGHLKGRFRRLREISVRKLSRIVSLIISGCILHNLCVLHHDDVEAFIDNDDDRHPNAYPNIFVDGRDGALFRQQLMNTMPL